VIDATEQTLATDDESIAERSRNCLLDCFFVRVCALKIKPLNLQFVLQNISTPELDFAALSLRI